MSQKNALILCSGGLDSVTTAHYVKKKLGHANIRLLFFNYSQKALLPERKCAKFCAKMLNAKFIEINLEELGKISASLINKPGKANKITKDGLKNTSKESENWYVPCRNLVFLSYALALAESIEINERKKCDIFVGFKNEGKDPFPDATPEFLEGLNKVSSISTKGKYKIFAPLIEKDKEDIVILGKDLKIDFKKTFSCYIGKETHCGRCLACKLRQQGFYWANEKDLTEYSS